MELEYSFLYNQKSMKALEHLCSIPMEGKLAYNISRIKFQCDKNFKILQTKFSDFYKIYAEKDEKGNSKLPDEKGSFPIEKDKVEAWQNEISTLLKTKFECPKCFKLSLDDIELLTNVSADDFCNLEMLLDV